MLVKWDGVNRMYPGRRFELFRDKPELFRALKQGEEIEIPDELYGELKAVVEVKKPKPKPKKVEEE